MSRQVVVASSIITLDDRAPRVEALVVEGETVAFAGSRSEALRFAGPGATLTDVGPRTIVPGFNDNHLHLVIHGDHAYSPNLTGLDERRCIEVMVAFAAQNPGDSLLVGYGWDYPSCPHPHRSMLDEAFGERPVALAQFGGHGLWVNSVVLRSLGIDRDHQPSEGRALVDDRGEPTGVVQELGAASPIGAYFHDIFFQKSLREPRIRRALDEYRRLGITSVQDNSWYLPVVHTLRRFRAEGTLTARVNCWSLGREPGSRKAFARAAYDEGWVGRGPQKEFLDGTFTTRTAWLTEPYPGHGDEVGLGYDPTWLEGVLERLARQGRQGAFHSIGDLSTQVFLDIWQKVVKRHPRAVDLRMRLEHGQVIRPEDLSRLRDLGVCIAAQPPALAFPEKDRAILGRDRAIRCYPHRSLLDAGVPLSFGSDIPGESICDPLKGMRLVTTRPGPEALTPLEALKAYTTGSAYVEFAEHRKGRLAPGFFADWAVVTHDPTTADGLAQARVVQTVVGGRSVWTETT